MATIREVIARLVVEGEGPFGDAIGRAGQTAEDAGASAAQTGKGFRGLAKDLGVAVGGAIAVRKGFGFLKDAANKAQTLAKSTAGLQRQTGLDAQTASGWVSMAKARGIETTKLTTSFTAFSKQLAGVEQGSKGATTAFQNLGLSADQIKGKPFAEQMGLVADRFEALPAGADRSALAVKLFGKQGLSLLPILQSGSAGINEQMSELQKAGLTMDESGVKKSLELAKAQRRMKQSTEGVKTAIGQALIPILATLADKLLPIIQKFAELINQSPILAGLVVGIGGAFVALLVISKVIAIMQGIAAAFGITATAATILWAALGIGLVIALIAGLVILYQKVGWFRDGVNAAFNAIKTAVGFVVNFIKDNWKLLATILLMAIPPLALVFAAFLLLKNKFGTIVNAIKTGVSAIVGFITSIPGRIAGVASRAFDALKTGFNAAKNAVHSGVNAVVSFVASLPGRIAGAFGDGFSAIINAAKELPGKVLGAIGNLGSQIKDKIMGPLSDVGGFISGLNPFAQGGLIAAAGGAATTGGRRVLVGERGPEIATMPSGTRITPLPPPSLAASQLGGGGGRPVIAQVFLERRMIAEAMASEAAERQAAR